MSIECSECERDLRGDHGESCSRHPNNLIPELREENKQLRTQLTEAKASLDDAQSLFWILVHSIGGYVKINDRHFRDYSPGTSVLERSNDRHEPAVIFRAYTTHPNKPGAE